MSRLKKRIVCWVALAFMPSPKAAAVEWSYGIKAGGAILPMPPHVKKLKKIYEGRSLKFIKSTPCFVAALYMECAFNDHIGMGTELLYNRFGFSVGITEVDTNRQEYSFISIVHTIGLPVLLIWSWTGAIRPDFKEDYFHGRFFWGLHPFFVIGAVNKVMDGTGRELAKDNILDKNESRFRLGFILGASFEFPHGLLLEAKQVRTYNLSSDTNKEYLSSYPSFHLSAGYNFAKLLT